MREVSLAIVGGGPAGLSAAISARESGLGGTPPAGGIVIIERGRALGGILNQCIHNGFGLHIFKEELTGPEYAHRLVEACVRLGIEYKLNTMVTDLGTDTDGAKTLTLFSREGAERIRAKAVILAMGCRERPRGALRIPGSRCAGIYTAGLAQELVNMKGLMPGKTVVVLGSGDIGLIMARRMTLEGAEVKGVYELMPYSGGLKRNIAQCLNDYGIPLKLSHTVTRIEGQEFGRGESSDGCGRLRGVWTAAVDASGAPIYATEEFTACDTLLLSVGLIPENELSKRIGVRLSEVTGGPLVDDSLQTSVPGVFACGNVLHVHDLADNVTLEAYRAGESAARCIRGGAGAFGVTGGVRRIGLRAGRGVRYVVPNEIILPAGPKPSAGPDAEPGAEYTAYFRSDNVYRDVYIRVRLAPEGSCSDSEGAVIKSVSKRIVTPGEMETLKFSLETGKAATLEVRIEAKG